jgi:nucleoside-diphosphate-sugar epimerase
MRVFITGATGFIGTNALSDLVAAEHKPIGRCRAAEELGLPLSGFVKAILAV